MNPSYPSQIQGKVGELLLQIRLFENKIESSIPVIDSGNDIIALKGHVVKSIQVKTKGLETAAWDLRDLPEVYDILALIEFAENEHHLDEARIHLLEQSEVMSGSISSVNNSKMLSEGRLLELFGGG
jgi:hypothetical protein